MAATSRWALRYPLAADNAAPHTDLQNLATDADTFGKDDQGVFASRPVSTPGSPGKFGRYYYATDRKFLSRDFGTGWNIVEHHKVCTTSPVALSGTTEQDMGSVTILGGTLVPNDVIHVRASGTTGGINGTKVLRLWAGTVIGTQIITASPGALNDMAWEITADINVIDATQLDGTGIIQLGAVGSSLSSSVGHNATITYAAASDLIIKVRGQKLSTIDTIQTKSLEVWVQPA